MTSWFFNGINAWQSKACVPRTNEKIASQVSGQKKRASQNHTMAMIFIGPHNLHMYTCVCYVYYITVISFQISFLPFMNVHSFAPVQQSLFCHQFAWLMQWNGGKRDEKNCRLHTDNGCRRRICWPKKVCHGHLSGAVNRREYKL